MNYRYVTLVVLWMGLIFCLSSIPSLGFGLGGIQEQISRKSIHVIVYGILTLLIWHSFPKLDKELSKKIALCGFLAILFAIGDEIHQGFVPGRSGNARGVIFDSIGVVLTLVWLGFRNSRSVRITKTATK